jgi:hypothetical protein
VATFTYDLDVLFGLPNGRSNFLGSAATDRDVYKLDIGSNTERPILALLLYNLSRDVDIALYADSDRNGVFNSDFDVSLRRSVNSGTQNDLIRFDTLSTASPNGLYFAVVTPFAQSSGSGQFNYTISASKIQQPLPSGASVNFTTLSSRSPSFEINTEVRGELIGAISSNQTNSVIFATVYADSNTNGIFDSADSLFSNKTYTYTIANQAQALSITIPAGKSFLNLRSAGSNPIATVTGAFSAWGKKNDFSRDGFTDIVLQNLSEGWSGVWTMLAGVRGWNGLPSANGATIAAIGDLNNDGKSDIIYQNLAQGWSGFRTQDGTTTLNWTGLPSTSGATIVDIGDLNNDGKNDIILQSLTGGWSGVWTMNGTTVTGWAGLPATSGATIAGVGDFNGDGKNDIVLQNLSQGWSGVWTMNGTTVTGWAALPTTAGATIASVGNFSGDLTSDIVLQNLSQGWSGIWTMNGTTVTGWAALPTTAGATIV